MGLSVELLILALTPLKGCYKSRESNQIEHVITVFFYICACV